MTEGGKSGDQVLYKEADKHCKKLLGRLSRGSGCVKATVFVVAALGVGVAFLRPTLVGLDQII